MKSTLPVVSGVVLGLLLLLSFGIDWDNVTAGGTIDFRNRLTGARLLQTHRDAYHYKWRKPEPPELCDPYNNLALPISRVTVTPTLLMLNFPLASLRYRPAQYAWLIAQWLLLLGTAFLWMRALPSTRLRWLWTAAVTGFTYTVTWRHHTDRGQAYVLILFLLSCWTLISRHARLGNSLWGGLVAGLLVAVRPPLVLLVAPFILMRRRGQIVGAVVGLTLGAGLPLLWDATCWSDYRQAMQTWSELYRAGTANPRPPPQAYPNEIEGLPIDVIARFGVIPFADSSLYALLRSCGFSNVSAAPVTLSLLASLAFWFRCSRTRSDERLLIGIAAWAFLVDLFIPAPRNSYNDVQILSLLALGLLAPGRLSLRVTGLLLAAWPLNWAVMAALPRAKWIINLPSVVMMTAAVLFLLLPVFEKHEAEARAETDS